MVDDLGGPRSGSEKVVAPNAAPVALQTIVDSLYEKGWDSDIRALTPGVVVGIGEKMKNHIGELDRKSIYYLIGNPRFVFRRLSNISCSFPSGSGDWLSEYVNNWVLGVGELLVARLRQLDEESAGGGCGEGKSCGCKEVAFSVHGQVSAVADGSGPFC